MPMTIVAAADLVWLGDGLHTRTIWADGTPVHGSERLP
jgi:hypothetical protein